MDFCLSIASSPNLRLWEKVTNQSSGAAEVKDASSGSTLRLITAGEKKAAFRGND